MASLPGTRKLEVEFFRMLNRVVEPMVRAGVGSPRFVPTGFVVLETVGRRTGAKRRSPLAATRIGRHVVVGTYRGDRSQWVRNLASKERLLHPNPHKRLRLPDLLAAITEASLDHFAYFGGATPLGVRKGSSSNFGSIRTSSRRGSGAFAV